MNSMIVFAADWEGLLRLAGVAIFFLLWGLGPILKGIAERNAKRAREARRAQQAAGQRAGEAPGAPNPEAEVERFLREVARNRGDGGNEPDTLAVEIVLEDEPTPPASRPKPAKTMPVKKGTAPARRGVSTATESIESRQMQGTLRDRPERHSELEYADEKMASHVHDVFDHKLGQLGTTTGRTPLSETPAATSAPERPIASRTALATSSANVAGLLRDPATVRQAILIHEILGPPRCESADVGRHD